VGVVRGESEEGEGEREGKRGRGEMEMGREISREICHGRTQFTNLHCVLSDIQCCGE